MAPNTRCSFCGKGQDQVRKLVAGPGVFICDQCIDLCQEVVEEDSRTATSKKAKPGFIPNPKTICATLDQYDQVIRKMGLTQGGPTPPGAISHRSSAAPVSTPALAGLGLACACGPHAHVPPRPVVVAGALAPTDSLARLARRLAPILYLQRDEWFPLERAVAVVHPTRPIIAYHLLWQDDVHGSWIPFTVPTDQEVVWVGYDRSGAPTDLWTYWHGKTLHADWRPRGTPAVDVQWGKHGLMPHGLIESDLPQLRKLNDFYAYHFIFLPDILLGRLTRPPPRARLRPARTRGRASRGRPRDRAARTAACTRRRWPGPRSRRPSRKRP